MAELVTIYRVDIEEAKALIAKEYGIKAAIGIYGD